MVEGGEASLSRDAVRDRARTRRHRRHSSLLVGYRRREVMIDCGLDRRDGLARLRPAAIVLTHAHPDHAAGLRHGAPCPVYAPTRSQALFERDCLEAVGAGGRRVRVLNPCRLRAESIGLWLGRVQVVGTVNL